MRVQLTQHQTYKRATFTSDTKAEVELLAFMSIAGDSPRVVAVVETDDGKFLQADLSDIKCMDAHDAA